MNRNALVAICVAALAAGCETPSTPLSGAVAAVTATPTPTLSEEIELDAPVYRADPDGYPLAAAPLGDGWAVMRRPGLIQRVARDGQLLDRIGVPAPSTSTIGMDGDGDQLVFAYVAYAGTQPRLLLQRYDRALHPVGAAIEVSRDASVGGVHEVLVVLGGGTALVGWKASDGERVVRVAADGHLIDAAPIQVGAGTDFDAAWDGEGFGLVWKEGTRAPSGDFVYQVSIARLTAAGELVSKQQVDAALYLGEPDICFGGGHFLVTFVGPEDFNHEVHAVLYDPALQFGEGVALEASPGAFFSACAWIGNRFLVTWDDNGASAFFVANGNDVPRPFTLRGAYTDHILAAGNGDTALIVRDAGTMRVSSAGRVLDGNPVTLAWLANRQGTPSAAAGGGGYLLAWQETWNNAASRTVYRAFDDKGAPRSAAPVVVPALWGTEPRVAFDGQRFLIAWVDFDFDTDGNANVSLRAVRVGADGRLLDTRALVIDPAASASIDVGGVAGGGGGFLITWTRSGDTALHARRIGSNGALSPTFQAVTLSDREGAGPVGFDGENYQVYWHAWDGHVTTLRTTRVTPAGTVLDPDGIVGPALGAQHVASDGAGVQVLGTGDRAGASELRTTRIGRDGRATAPVAIGPGSAYFGGLTWDGASFVAGWWSSTSASISRFAADGRLFTGVLELGPGASGPVVAALTPDRALVAYDVDDARLDYQTRRLRLRWFTPLASGASCEQSVECREGGCNDHTCGAPADAGVDAAPAPVDAAPVDATVDATVDAAPVDAAVDAALDAAVDAGAPDATAAVGTPDAASVESRPDASLPPLPADEGCGCRTGGGAPGAALVLAALLMPRRRRRPAATA